MDEIESSWLFFKTLGEQFPDILWQELSKLRDRLAKFELSTSSLMDRFCYVRSFDFACVVPRWLLLHSIVYARGPSDSSRIRMISSYPRNASTDVYSVAVEQISYVRCDSR